MCWMQIVGHNGTRDLSLSRQLGTSLEVGGGEEFTATKSQSSYL